ncbi:MAG: hypothetical protein J5U19_01095, partial [Candidatus Methanoperedens sp.]|nr:hypothetical protein [Candidatus Methanoperedens sp.]
MNIVYFSHSYREEDRGLVEYFGELIQSQGLIPSLDPPSDSVNAAKLERHLNNSDGTIPSPLISLDGRVAPGHPAGEAALLADPLV